MPYLLNLVYLIAFLLASPWLAYKAITTGKYRRMLRKFLGLTPTRRAGSVSDRCCAWFHGVSVGEVLLLRQVIARFRKRHPDWDCVISTTTNTGYDVAVANYPDLLVFYWPFDFTWAVKRALRRIRPSLIVLAELELWPNFLTLAERAGCPVAVVNGRMSPRSFRGYSRIRGLMARMLGQVQLLAVQNHDYADRLQALGAAAARLHVTGSVKYDGVSAERDNPKSQELAHLVGCDASHPTIWIAGSTQSPEEARVLDIYRRLREKVKDLRLILVPRHKERFDEVAGMLTAGGVPFVRRSAITEPLAEMPPIVLVDTLGELGAWWALGDVAFVGGSLTPRGGQNMIEPAAYGLAVTFGPNTWNFRDTVEQLVACRGAIPVADAAELESTTLELLTSPETRAELGRRARAFVLSQQGATERTLDLLDGRLGAEPAALRACG